MAARLALALALITTLSIYSVLAVPLPLVEHVELIDGDSTDTEHPLSFSGIDDPSIKQLTTPGTNGSAGVNASTPGANLTVNGTELAGMNTSNISANVTLNATETNGTNTSTIGANFTLNATETTEVNSTNPGLNGMITNATESSNETSVNTTQVISAASIQHDHDMDSLTAPVNLTQLAKNEGFLRRAGDNGSNGNDSMLSVQSSGAGVGTGPIPTATEDGKVRMRIGDTIVNVDLEALMKLVNKSSSKDGGLKAQSALQKSRGPVPIAIGAMTPKTSQYGKSESMPKFPDWQFPELDKKLEKPTFTFKPIGEMHVLAKKFIPDMEKSMGGKFSKKIPLTDFFPHSKPPHTKPSYGKPKHPGAKPSSMHHTIPPGLANPYGPGMPLDPKGPYANMSKPGHGKPKHPSFAAFPGYGKHGHPKMPTPHYGKPSMPGMHGHPKPPTSVFGKPFTHGMPPMPSKPYVPGMQPYPSGKPFIPPFYPTPQPFTPWNPSEWYFGKPSPYSKHPPSYSGMPGYPQKPAPSTPPSQPPYMGPPGYPPMPFGPPMQPPYMGPPGYPPMPFGPPMQPPYMGPPGYPPMPYGPPMPPLYYQPMPFGPFDPWTPPSMMQPGYHGYPKHKGPEKRKKMAKHDYYNGYYPKHYGPKPYGSEYYPYGPQYGPKPYGPMPFEFYPYGEMPYHAYPDYYPMPYGKDTPYVPKMPPFSRRPFYHPGPSKSYHMNKKNFRAFKNKPDDEKDNMQMKNKKRYVNVFNM